MRHIAATESTFKAVLESPLSRMVWIRTATGKSSEEGFRKGFTKLEVPGKQREGLSTTINVIQSFVQDFGYVRTGGLLNFNPLPSYHSERDDSESVEVIIFELSAEEFHGSSGI